MTDRTTTIPGTAPEKPEFRPSAPVSPGTITRPAFERLSPADRHRAVREGWKIVDDPAPKPSPRISQAAFDGMPAAGRDGYRARGGLIHGEPEPKARTGASVG